MAPTPAADLFNAATALQCLGFLEDAALDRSGRPRAGSPVPAAEGLTYFHSLSLPRITLGEMAEKLVASRLAISWPTIAIAGALFARFDATFPVSANMMHRLFVTCVVVAAKAHQERAPSNGRFGRTVEMQGAELTHLELELAGALDWHFVVEASDPVWRHLAAQAAARCTSADGWGCGEGSSDVQSWLATVDSPSDDSPWGPHDVSEPSSD